MNSFTKLTLENLKINRFPQFFNKELVKGSFISLLLRGSGFAVAYVFTILIGHQYGPSLLGSFILTLVVLDILGILNSMGMETAIVALISRYNLDNRQELIKQILKKAYIITASVGFIITILCFFFIDDILQFFFKKPELSGFIKIMLFSVLPLSLIRLNANFLRGLKKITEFGLINYNLVYFIALLLFFIFQNFYKAETAVSVSFTLSSYISFLISLFYVKRSEVMNFSFSEPRNNPVKSLMKISIPLFYSDILTFIRTWSGVILLGYFVNSEFVGIYGIISKLTSIPGMIIIALGAIAMPIIGQSYGRGDWNSIQKTVTNSTKLLCSTAIPVTFVIAIFGNLFVSIIGKEFNKGYTALLIMCLGQLFEIILGSVTGILQVTNKQNVYKNIILADSVIIFLLYLILIPPFGINGAAFAMLLSNLFRLISVTFYVNKKLKIRLI